MTRGHSYKDIVKIMRDRLCEHRDKDDLTSCSEDVFKTLGFLLGNVIWNVSGIGCDGLHFILSIDLQKKNSPPNLSYISNISKF